MHGRQDKPDITLALGDLPLALRSIPDPPRRLYCRGDPAALDRPAVAIVGSRRCSRQGRETAFALGRDLIAQGVSVVSGLAYGIDAAAHRGALATFGDGSALSAPHRPVTIAVLGSGLDNIYPRAHAGLAAEIVAAGGAVLSEHEPDEGPRKHHFPARNRIVSGLCLGVVIVEASDKSGSLITARLALEQGRDVMAVPSLVSSPLSAGCHRLIRQGAALVEQAEHVMEALVSSGRNITSESPSRRMPCSKPWARRSPASTRSSLSRACPWKQSSSDCWNSRSTGLSVPTPVATSASRRRRDNRSDERRAMGFATFFG